MEFLTAKVLFISVFIIIIHCIETLAYAVRLSSAKVRKIATGLSLFSMMAIVARMLNMMQQPFTGSLIDTAPAGKAVYVVGMQYRVLIGAATVGTIIGIVLIPTFVSVFSRAIMHLVDKKGNVFSLVKLKYLKRGIKDFRLPAISYIKDIDFKSVPKRLFLLICW